MTRWYQTLYRTYPQVIVHCYRCGQCGASICQGTGYYESSNSDYRRLINQRKVEVYLVSQEMWENLVGAWKSNSNHYGRKTGALQGSCFKLEGSYITVTPKASQRTSPMEEVSRQKFHYFFSNGFFSGMRCTRIPGLPGRRRVAGTCCLLFTGTTVQNTVPRVEK